MPHLHCSLLKTTISDLIRSHFGPPPTSFDPLQTHSDRSRRVVFLPPKSGKYHFLIVLASTPLIPQDPHTGNVSALSEGVYMYPWLRPQ